MPRNTAMGLVISLFSLIMCFALVWHIWWLAIVGLVATIGGVIWRSADDDIDYYVPAEEVARIENQRIKMLAEA
jgi:cytochrome o ubiquinol oxidase subunit 1